MEGVVWEQAGAGDGGRGEVMDGCGDQRGKYCDVEIHGSGGRDESMGILYIQTVCALLYVPFHITASQSVLRLIFV